VALLLGPCPLLEYTIRMLGTGSDLENQLLVNMELMFSTDIDPSVYTAI